MHICILNNNVNSKVNVINITLFLLLFLTSYFVFVTFLCILMLWEPCTQKYIQC